MLLRSGGVETAMQWAAWLYETIRRMILAVILLYFLLLLAVSRLTAAKGGNDVFFRGGRQSPWYLVAFGMVGASISGITFVSVPGMVIHSGMSYLYTCFGFIFGYFAVAFLLLPVYYKLSLTTIYSVLKPLGNEAYKTGAAFFLLSKTMGAAARFYVPCYIIYQSMVQTLQPTTPTPQPSTLLFPLTVIAMVALIWVYTRRGGIKTLVWTDTLQTVCMFTALLLIIYKVSEALFPNLSGWSAVSSAFAAVFTQQSVPLDAVGASGWVSFLSGIFIVIVMTGLDQDMMQKNLTWRSLRDARKDMCAYSFAFFPANFLFLSLGVMLCMLCEGQGTALPEKPDDLLTMFATTGRLGTAVMVFFAIGIVAAAFSSDGSARTALATCFCVDILGIEVGDGKQDSGAEKTRQRVHKGVAVAFVVCIILVHLFNNTSLIDAIYRLCSYTYGPLLGLFAFALLHKKHACSLGPLSCFACVSSPLLCLLLDNIVPAMTGYRFGYELLMLNGLITYAALEAISQYKKK